MFYEEDIIDDILTCPKCKLKYNDPRMLPCGKTYCNHCINLQLNNDKIGFDCDYCMFFHELIPPSSSFPQDKRIEKLLENEQKKISESKLITEFKQLLQSLKNLTEELTSNKSQSPTIINEYCSDIKTSINETTNNLLHEIQNQKEELFNIVSSYEDECFKNINKVDLINNDLSNMAVESDKFQAKWNDYLNNQVVKESEVRDAFESGNEVYKQISNHIDTLKLSQLNNKLVIFEPTKPTNQLIGKIYFENFNQNSIKFENFFKLDLKYRLNLIDRAYYDSIHIFRFSNGDFLFTYQISPFKVKMSLLCDGFFQREYEIVKPVNKFKITINGEKIFFSFTKSLRIFDKSFLILVEKSCDENIDSMAATNDFLYCLTENNYILKYDHDLRLFQKIRINQENVSVQKKLSNLKIYSECIYLCNTNDIVTIDLKNLVESDRLKIKEKKLIFYNGKIVALNSDEDFLALYDLNGKVIKKQSLSKTLSKNLILVESENFEKISFFDFSNYILYY
ncbi:unnamed protein product [Brachionus calyciflorus]|uniref:RING-type domain-containing protein n=1 Tax=Brachionus calyciflorus TaxID=104777 RepID=A0A813PNR1_9BILA|nr:unnamed protein product [Brachionus calyciflorus]